MVEYVVSDNVSGAKKTLRVQKALLSIGRVPNVENLGLDKAEVALNDRGHIELRDVVGTSQPHIAAVGDMTADMSLVNVAEIEARYAAHRFFSPVRRQPHFLDDHGRFKAT